MFESSRNDYSEKGIDMTKSLLKFRAKERLLSHLHYYWKIQRCPPTKTSKTKGLLMPTDIEIFKYRAALPNKLSMRLFAAFNYSSGGFTNIGMIRYSNFPWGIQNINLSYLNPGIESCYELFRKKHTNSSPRISMNPAALHIDDISAMI
jgi:hypothetical protein